MSRRRRIDPGVFWDPSIVRKEIVNRLSLELALLADGISDDDGETWREPTDEDRKQCALRLQELAVRLGICSQ